MDRRSFIKSLSAVPFIPSIDWGKDKPYFQYYFGGFRTGKTTRLINDAIDFLEKNPVQGLYLATHFHSIDYAIGIIKRFDAIQHYKLSARTLTFKNGASLRFGMYGSTPIYSNYKALWTDGLDIRASNKHIIHEQHVVSMEAARMIQKELRLNPIELGRGLYGILSLRR